MLLRIPLEEVALLSLILGTDEELSSVVGIKLSDLPEDGLTAMATLWVMEVGPSKMLTRLTSAKTIIIIKWFLNA